MKRHFFDIRKNITILMAALIVITSLGISQVLATASPIAVDHIVGDLTPVAEAPLSDFTVGFAAEDGSDYVQPTHTYFDGSPSFYFVTGDPTYELLHGTSKTVIRASGVYDATIIYTPRAIFTQGSLTIADVSPLPTAFFSRLAGAADARANATFFFDAGRFIDMDYLDTNNLSGANTSLVGLYSEGGEPATTFYRRPEPTTNTMMRWRFNTPHNYLENIILDGSSINMRTPNGWGTGNDRGSYFIVVGTNSDEFVAKDVIIQNIGSQNTSVNQGGILAGANGNQRNVALNILRATGGQRNFENLTIRNVMTTGGYGVIQFNNTANNYFRNLNVINPNAAGTGTAQNANAQPIKIEHNVTQAEIDIWLGGDVSNQRNIVFDGTLLVPNRNSVNDDVYIQDYRYRNILVPANFAWALLRTSNGGNNTAAIRVYNHKRSAIALHAPLQLDTGYWFVETAVTTPNLQTQLNNINTVINVASPLTTAPAPRIKMVANGGQLGGFTVPNFATTANIVALFPTETPASSLHPALAHAAGGYGEMFVPYIGGPGGIVLPPSSTHLLFNFNFRTPAEWTIEDATTGGSIVNFQVANSGSNLFVRYLYPFDITYTFTSSTAGMVLPQAVMNLLPPPALGVASGATQPSPTITPTTVDVAGGTWTFQGWDREMVTINNANETVIGTWIFTSTPVETFDITYTFVSGTTGMALPPAVTDLLPPPALGLVNGATRTSPVITPTTVTVAAGTWTFQGWDRASVTIDGADETVTGVWVFTETTQPPIEPEKETNETGIPRTGQTLNFLMLIGLLMLALGILITGALKKKKP